MSQPCPYCGSSDFEEEDGLLVCTSCGRQQEGGLQVADDDADFGTQGKIARRKVEKTKVKVTKIYRGAKAYKLYLQAWQHILWRQCYALTHGPTQAPSQLWTAARDLWALKLSTLLDRLGGKVKDDRDELAVSNTEYDASSAPESDQTQRQTKQFLGVRLWDTISLVYLAALLIRQPLSLSTLYDLIRSENVPYIRAVRFVPYEITSHLPSEYQLALDTTTIPQRREFEQSAHRLVQTFALDFGIEVPAINWRILLHKWIIVLGLPLDIYGTVKQLAIILQYNFTYDFTKNVSTTKPSSDDAILRKVGKPRRSPIAMPEIQLMSLIIVSAKLLFPFPMHESSDGDKSATERSKDGSDSITTQPSLTDLSLDWPTWHSIHRSYCSKRHASDSNHDINNPSHVLFSDPAKHIETTDRDVANMSPEDMDAYIAWYQRMFSTPDAILKQKKTELEMSILEMFPAPEMSQTSSQATRTPKEQQQEEEEVQPSRSSADARDLRDEEQTERPSSPSSHNPTKSDPQQELCAEIHRKAIRYTPNSIQKPYIIFSTVEALSSPVPSQPSHPSHPSSATKNRLNSEGNPILAFHTLAAEIACTDLKSLVRAVRYTEGKMEVWIRERRRIEVFGGREHQDDDDLEGVEEQGAQLSEAEDEDGDEDKNGNEVEMGDV